MVKSTTTVTYQGLFVFSEVVKVYLSLHYSHWYTNSLVTSRPSRQRFDSEVFIEGPLLVVRLNDPLDIEDRVRIYTL